MEKIRTIIADDDHLVRSYLKMLTAWERAGFEIVAEARDGEEALDMIKKTPCSLLVTDLSMPLMDGIKLIRNVRRINPKLYIIVLSCHDEFAYVKDAMKEGADEYVLKNALDEESLYELLLTTRSKIEEKEKTNVELQSDVFAKYQFFNGLLAGNLNDREREEKRRQAGVQGHYINSAVIALLLEEWEEQAEGDLFLKMEQYCQDFMIRLQNSIDIEVVYLGKGVFCAFLDLSDIHKSSQMYQKLTSTATSLYQICKCEKYRYCIGVSNVCIGQEAIRQAYQQSRETMKLRFYDDSEILYYDGSRKVSDILPKAAEEFLEEAARYVHRNDQEGFERKAATVIEAFSEELTEKRLVLQWAKRLETALGIMHEQTEPVIQHIDQLNDWIEKCKKSIFENHREIIPPDINPAVKAAAEYVLKHYKEQVGLQDAAQAAGVNATYLSYLFQKEMNVGFSNFLLSRRMECAKEVLAKTNLKVREVAECSGFNDYHYFAKTFKKMFDVSPAEYRKRVQQ